MWGLKFALTSEMKSLILPFGSDSPIVVSMFFSIFPVYNFKIYPIVYQSLQGSFGLPLSVGKGNASQPFKVTAAW